MTVGCLIALGLEGQEWLLAKILGELPSLLSLQWVTHDISFYTYVSAGILYPFFAFPAMKHARKGILGVDPELGKLLKQHREKV